MSHKPSTKYFFYFDFEYPNSIKEATKEFPLAPMTDKVTEDMFTPFMREYYEQLKKQEHDYLKGYSIYVKTKEKELKTLIQKLNAKNSNNTLKDETIYKLNQKVDSLNKERVKMESEKQELNEKIKHWMARAQAFEQDKNFL